MSRSNDLMVGTGTMTFSPDGEMSRAMLVTVLYRMNGSPSVAGMTMPVSGCAGRCLVHGCSHLGI